MVKTVHHQLNKLQPCLNIKVCSRAKALCWKFTMSVCLPLCHNLLSEAPRSIVHWNFQTEYETMYVPSSVTSLDLQFSSGHFCLDIFFGMNDRVGLVSIYMKYFLLLSISTFEKSVQTVVNTEVLLRFSVLQMIRFRSTNFCKLKLDFADASRPTGFSLMRVLCRSMFWEAQLAHKWSHLHGWQTVGST